jgi:hypothetical protein
VLELQRALGNHAIARALQQRRGSAREQRALLQREITIKNIDYDPRPGEGFRDGYVDAGKFYPALYDAVFGDDQFALFKNQLRNAFDVLKQQDWEDLDVERLATGIADAIVAFYEDKGMTAISGKRDRLRLHATRQLSKSIRPDFMRDMDKGEQEGFDRLKGIVGEPNMSRAKGRASPIQYASLPQELSTAVQTFVTGVNQENASWTAANLTAQFTLPSELNTDLSRRQRDTNRYQGNHTNMAGWLPAGNAPVSAVVTLSNQIYAQASGGLKTRLTAAYPAQRLGIVGQQGHPNHNPYRNEYQQLLGAAPYGLSDQQLRRSLWAGLAAGVGPYIEFSTTSSVSRIVYDCVADRIYLSAHYKWREGYNPWFEVLGAPAFVF